MLMYNLIVEYRKQNDDLDADEFLDFASEEMSQFDLDYVTQQTIDQEEDDLWHDMRIGRITASKIYEASKCHTQNGYLKNLIMGSVSIPNNYAMSRGLSLQEDVIDAVSQELDESLSCCGLILDSEHPAIGASPDAVGPDFVVEIKCPTTKQSVRNFIFPNKRLKTKFYSQIQLQMHVKDVDHGYFVIADPDFESTNDVDIIRIEYNYDFTSKLIDDSMKFWKSTIFTELLDYW